MAIGTITAIAIAMIALIGGGTAGILARQPEINRLKKQVKKLQAEIVRLQGLIDKQDSQIRELTLRYKRLMFFQFIKKRKLRGEIREQLLMQYAYHDYMDLLMTSVRNKQNSMADEDKIFFNLFEKTINNESLDEGENAAIRKYIELKHEEDLISMKEYDNETMLKRLIDFKA